MFESCHTLCISQAVSGPKPATVHEADFHTGSARRDCQVDPQGGVTYQDEMVERDGKPEEQGQSWQEASAIYDVGHVRKQRLSWRL